MQSVTVKAERTGEFPGEINIRVDPSHKFQPGLFVLSNYHYQLPADALHSDATELLLKFLKAEWSAACQKARIVADEIFDKIKPDNAKHS